MEDSAKDTGKEINAHGNAAKIVLLSAVGSGAGKTTATAALARSLMRDGLRVSIFKIGPDYLDPMILQRACGAEVYALDLWMVGLDGCRRLLAQAAQEADVILIEGVKSLYDGDAMSAELARTLDIPVLLVLDASGMTQSASAFVPALQQYGSLPDSLPIAGVILNRADESRIEKIRRGLRTTPFADTTILATIPPQKDSFPKRHWMQLSSQQQATIDHALDQLGEQIVIDMQAWQRLPLTTMDDAAAYASASSALLFAGKKIAVACDAAFAFAYFGNLKCLRDAGAQLQFFSPLRDEPAPPDADAIYLPGGYPEQHCATLAAAQRWQDSMRAAHAAGKPILAECGGMMTLVDRIRDVDGKVWAMAGLLPGEVSVHADLVALGMQTLATDDGTLRGHVFHYSTLATPLTPCASTLKRRNGERGEEVYRHGSLTATYFHAYFSSCPTAVASMLAPQQS